MNVIKMCIRDRIVPQAHAYVIERLGAYHATWETGFHMAIPIIDKISKRISLKDVYKRQDKRFPIQSPELGRRLGAVVLRNIPAVSYTHLDVYKRQPSDGLF